MQNPEYDNRGGIINVDVEKKENNFSAKERKGYTFLESLLLKYSPKINYLLDENGRYKCRKLKFPPVIRIGPTNRCTARCFYCPREYIHDKGSGYMEWEMYKSIVDQAKIGGADKISFALFGEPLLHPRIIDMLAYAKRAGLKIGLSTNGIILTKSLADKIIDLKLETFECSMDGYTRKEFMAGKQVDKYEQAKNNLLYLFKRAEEQKSQTVYNVHFVDIGHVSLKNKIRFIKYWSKKLERLKSMTGFYYEPHNWAGTRDYLRKQMNFFDRILTKISFKKPCMYIKGININYNGDVYVCTNDPTEKAIIGNIKRNSIEEIYNGEKREKFLKENEQGAFQDVNCNICTANTVLPLSFIKKRIINLFAKML